MKKHTMQEWADWLGVVLVKNNFRVKDYPPGVFHCMQVSAFMHEPEVVKQRYGAPCYVDMDLRRNGIEGGAVNLNAETVIGPELWQLVSDIYDVKDFEPVYPAEFGESFPVSPLSSGSLKQMEIADALEPTKGTTRKYTRGDPIGLTQTKNPETSIEQIESKYKEISK